MKNVVTTPKASTYHLLIKSMKKLASEKVARFRGGECLSEQMTTGDLYTPLSWRCWRGHSFQLTPNSVLRGGHWCPECSPRKIGWDYDREAQHNPFLAQVWYTNHGEEESNYYPPDCYRDIADVATS